MLGPFNSLGSHQFIIGLGRTWKIPFSLYHIIIVLNQNLHYPQTLRIVAVHFPSSHWSTVHIMCTSGKNCKEHCSASDCFLFRFRTLLRPKIMFSEGLEYVFFVLFYQKREERTYVFWHVLPGTSLQTD